MLVWPGKTKKVSENMDGDERCRDGGYGELEREGRL